MTSAIDTLVATGRVAEAQAMLDRAGNAGDAAALMALAVWYLRGTPIARDLPRARANLRRAVAIGHVDGALMEIALTANGSGGEPDWSAALGLLKVAAANDPVAAGQLDLVARMALNPDGTPRSLPLSETLAARPRIVVYRAALTPAECAHIATVGAPLLEPSRIVDPVTGAQAAHPVRTSDAGAIGPAREDLVVRAINLRLAALTATPIDHGEALTVLRYSPGQQYRPHLDVVAQQANPRVKTAIVYLNHGYGGGATVFPRLGLSVAAKGGDVLVFDNLLADGTADPATLHAGEPVRAGAKWIATRWIHAAPIDLWNVAAG